MDTPEQRQHRRRPARGGSVIEAATSELEELRRREPRACEAFVDAHYRDVYRLLLWLTNNAEDAADLTQEAFTAFWISLEHLDASRQHDLRAWLYGIARNRWRKRCRGMARGCLDMEAVRDLPDDGPDPEALAVLAAERERVGAAVAGLPTEYGEALVLRVFNELTYAEIADALDVSEGLARWRVHHARAMLARRLAERGDENV
jgi:RNA polymerase sigma-70 factor (ECF subfamily)